ncbi:MAG: 50S ribosomal protein L13 [candidate division Zixibacteria bacterium]|nr:50S ribosomal protein L13 [candidate division Zixibacteria bacterium]
MKTYIPKIDSSNRKWHLVDLNGVVLGRTAVKVANILRGKDKPIFTPHMDTGDHVIAVNASGLKVSGKKLEQNMYYRYSGYPGGLKKTSFKKKMQSTPEYVFIHAVKGMLPKNKLGRKMLKKLHVYAGDKHEHAAQKPELLAINK